MRVLSGLAAGPILAVVLLLALEAWISGLYPLPAGRDPMDPAVLAAWLGELPARMLVMWLAGWMLAAALAAMLATAIAGRRWVGATAGCLLLLPAVLNGSLVDYSGLLWGALLLMPVLGALWGVLLAGFWRTESGEQ